MATSPDVTSMALFCDFENVALGVRDIQHDKFDIKLVLERLLLKGSIVVKKAYCDWDRYKSFKSTMHEANFELIEIPHVRQSGKNSADIRLVVDALDLCYTKSHVNTFVIISGDSDFSPLVSKLRENNKQVIGVGVKQSTSDLLTANCDEFIFYDDLVRESGRQSSRREARPPAPAANRRPAAPAANPEENKRREEADARRTKGVEMALQTFEALYSERSDGGKIWASVLKEAIKRRKPDFSESYYGFRSFGGLLEEMQARGFLKMGRDEKSNAYVFRGGSESGNGAAAADPASAAPEVLPVTHRAGEAEAREPRGRGTRSRGGRRGAADRHDFEPTVAVETAQASLPYAADEDEDDAAERFADAARESQASREVFVGEAEAAAEDALEAGADTASTPADAEPAARDAGSRRGNRGGRGGRGGAKRADGREERAPREPRPAQERSQERQQERSQDRPHDRQAAAEPAFAPKPAPAPSPAPVAAPAAPVTAPVTASAAEPAAAKPPRKTAARKSATTTATDAPERAPRKTAAKTAAKPAAKATARKSAKPAPDAA